MPTLSNRFREVTVTLAGTEETDSPPTSYPDVTSPQTKYPESVSPQTRYPEASASGLIAAQEVRGFSPGGMPSPAPATIPASWLQLQQTAHTLRFVHTQADTEPIEQQVRALYPNATAIALNPMSLRDIFLALAKGKKPKGDANA
jgi:hypothetical protein